MAVFVSVFVVLGLAFHKNLTSVQKNSEFDLREVLWRDILTVLSFKFVFSLEVEKNCWCFTCPKLFDVWGQLKITSENYFK